MGGLSTKNKERVSRLGKKPVKNGNQEPEVMSEPDQAQADFGFSGKFPTVAAKTAQPAPAVSKYDENIEKMLLDADLHFKRGEMKAAEDIYLKVAAQDPKCSKAYSRLGVIYLEDEGCLEDAEAAFRQALKVEPNNGYILNNLGLVLYHQDKYADAIRNFELSVRLDEYNAARHANLGMAFLAVRQYAKAESSFKRALKLDPNEAEYKDLLNESIEKKQAHKAMIRK